MKYRKNQEASKQLKGNAAKDAKKKAVCQLSTLYVGVPAVLYAVDRHQVCVLHSSSTSIYIQHDKTSSTLPLVAETGGVMFICIGTT